MIMCGTRVKRSLCQNYESPIPWLTGVAVIDGERPNTTPLSLTVQPIYLSLAVGASQMPLCNAIQKLHLHKTDIWIWFKEIYRACFLSVYFSRSPLGMDALYCPQVLPAHLSPPPLACGQIFPNSWYSYSMTEFRMVLTLPRWAQTRTALSQTI